MAGWVYAAALLFCAGDWYAVARGRQALEWFFKPAALALIMLAAWVQTTGPHDSRAAPFMLAALAASLLGDVILLPPSARAFVAGLLSFLMAHIAYTVALVPSAPPALAYLLLPVIVVAGGVLLRGVMRGLERGGNDSLRAPVLAYAVVISIMLFTAWAGLFRPEWTPARQWATAAGATLFYMSDVLLAWIRFVAPLRNGSLVSIATYHIGQILLAASFAL